MGTTLIKSKWESGELYFYEQGVGRSTTGDILKLGTSEVAFGNSAQDIDVKIYLGSATEYVLFDAGNSRVDFGENDQGVDVRVFGNTASAVALFDTSADQLVFDNYDAKWGDNDYAKWGDATGGDVSVRWVSASSLFQWLPATNDTGSFDVGDGTTDMDVRVFLGAAGDNIVFNVGDKELNFDGDVRLDFSECTVAAANTDGGIIKAGTSGSRIVEDTADMKFMSFYFDNGATSGDNRGMYLRQYLTGAGGGGEAARIFTTVEDVAGGTAHGAHISLNFGSTGSITGLGVAMRATLQLANQAYTGLGGTYAALMGEIWSDGATTDPAGITRISILRLGITGDAGGIADVDDDAYMIELTGGTIGAGNMVQTEVDETKFSHKIKAHINGTEMYFMMTDS